MTVRAKLAIHGGEKVLNQTLNRTLITSITTLIVVIVLFIYGGNVLQPFAFTLIIGVILGTYSSLFIASPAMLWLDDKINIDTELDQVQTEVSNENSFNEFDGVQSAESSMSFSFI